MKLKSREVVEFRLIQAIGIEFWAIAIVVGDCVNKFKDCHTDDNQMNHRQPRQATLAVSANGCFITALPTGYNLSR